MKKHLGLIFLILFGIGFFMMPIISQALTLADVGGVDNLFSQTELADSGDNTELDFVNSILGGGLFFTSKTETEEGIGWQNISDAVGTYAYNISGYEADFFMVKTGNNTGNSNTHFLFKNIGDLDWAVIDFAKMGFSDENIENFGKLSHLDTFGNNQNNPVPEPATMLLLGTGLIGLSGLRRKFKK